MTEPAPVPEPGNSGQPMPLTHLEQWFTEHVFPDIADIRIKAENAIGAARKLAPALEKLSGLVVQVGKADPGISPEVLAAAEEAAGVVARVAADLAAAGI